MGHALTENRDGQVVTVAVTVASAGGGLEAAAGPAQARTAAHGGMRPELRREGVCALVPGHALHAVCGDQTARRGGGRSHHPVRGLRREHGRAQAGRGAFDRAKTTGLRHKQRHRGRPKVQWRLRFSAAGYNITLMSGLAM